MSEGRGEEGGGEGGGEDDETLFGSDEEDTNSTNEVFDTFILMALSIQTLRLWPCSFHCSTI